MTLPTLIEAIRCTGTLRNGAPCGRLLAKGAIVQGSIEVACPKCGKRTVIAGR